ncbi:hypothetical protein ABEW34_13750 [Paenibacillus algorifonticola]|uniref:hypothetical protein n=1 Tax=Paenibacillus algorifonticola TaxID=684063 RepID=UPI003D2AE3FE
MRIDIVRLDDNAVLGRLRECLKQALDNQNKLSTWSEWLAGDPRIPSYIKRKKEHALYINGVRVLSLKAGADVPDAAFLSRKIADLSAIPEPKGRRRLSYRFFTTVVPGIALIVLPKCAICGSAYMGLFEIIGLGVGRGLERPWLLPLMALMMMATVAAMAYRARERNGYGPVALAFVTSALMIAGKFSDSRAELYFGGGVLVGATVWNAIALPKLSAFQYQIKQRWVSLFHVLVKTFNLLQRKSTLK